VSLSWSAATDNFAVTRYIVIRDGEQIQTHVTARHASDKPGAGTHIYTVRAADAAGNVGPASPRASITIH